MKRLFLILCFALFCGVVFTGNVHASSLEGYPAFPSPPSGNHANYIVYSVSGIKYLHMFYSEGEDSSVPLANYKYSSGNQFLVVNPNTYIKSSKYSYLESSDTWFKDGGTTEFSAGTDYNVVKVGSFLYSDFDIVDSVTGEVVFQAPSVNSPTLAETILKAVESLQGTILKAMKIIALCGVGCLALLIGLNLLPKVLYRFL